MDRESDFSPRDEWALPEAVEAWQQQILNEGRTADPETQNGVIGISRSSEDFDGVIVFVGSETDTEDRDLYPETIDGTPINYVHIPLAEAQDLNAYN